MAFASPQLKFSLRIFVMRFMMNVLILFLLRENTFLFANETPANTAANVAANLAPNPAIARIVAFEKTGQLFGSATYIGASGEYGIVITNWHVVQAAESLLHVHFPNGFASFGYVLYTDRKWDLALVVISRPPAFITHLPIAAEVPRPGEPLWIAGYGAGSFRLAGGKCQRFLAPEIPSAGNPQYEYVELSVEARQGDSGGPILNRRGEVAGILFGSDSRNTAGSHCGRLRQFLTESTNSFQKLPAHPETLFASIEPDGPRHSLASSIRHLSVDPIAQVATQIK